MSENKAFVPDPQYLLQVRGLKEYFPIPTGFAKTTMLKAVDDVSFDIKKGETLGLVGESGCGKTTVGRTLLHLYAPTAGEVWFDDLQLTPVATIVPGAAELRRVRNLPSQPHNLGFED